MKNLGFAASVVSVLAGLFAIVDPLVALAVCAFGWFALRLDGEVVAYCAALVLFVGAGAAPFGFCTGLVGYGVSWLNERTVVPALIGLALNVLAPIIWLLIGAAVFGGFYYLFKDFHIP